MSDIFNSFQKSNRKYKALQEKNDVSYKEASTDRLNRVIKKKFDTSIIGAVASIEKHLGYLWAHGEKNESVFTKSQLDFRVVWNELRNEILTKGNNQLRGALLELAEYTVELKRKEYVVEFKDISPEYDNRGNK